MLFAQRQPTAHGCPFVRGYTAGFYPLRPYGRNVRCRQGLFIAIQEGRSDRRQGHSERSGESNRMTGSCAGDDTRVYRRYHRGAGAGRIWRPITSRWPVDTIHESSLRSHKPGARLDLRAPGRGVRPGRYDVRDGRSERAAELDAAVRLPSLGRGHRNSDRRRGERLPGGVDGGRGGRAAERGRARRVRTQVRQGGRRAMDAPARDPGVGHRQRHRRGWRGERVPGRGRRGGSGRTRLPRRRRRVRPQVRLRGGRGLDPAARHDGGGLGPRGDRG